MSGCSTVVLSLTAMILHQRGVSQTPLITEMSGCSTVVLSLTAMILHQRCLRHCWWLICLAALRPYCLWQRWYSISGVSDTADDWNVWLLYGSIVSDSDDTASAVSQTLLMTDMSGCSTVVLSLTAMILHQRCLRHPDFKKISTAASTMSQTQLIFLTGVSDNTESASAAFDTPWCLDTSSSPGVISDSAKTCIYAAWDIADF